MPDCSPSCKYWPPSAMDGKPCSICEPSDELLSCFEGKVGRPFGRKYGKPYSLRFSEEQRDFLTKLAEQRGKSEQETLRELVAEAFERSN